MRHIAALMLAQLGGNQNPSATDLSKILSSVGIQADEAQLSKLLAEVASKDVATLVAEGMKKLASMPSGGAAAPVAASGAAAAEPAAAAKGGKKEPEPVKEESDEEMGMGLFD